jgi:hypothetical protein
MRCGCVRTGPATGARARRSLPLGEVMGAILPTPISGKLLGAVFSHSFLIKRFRVSGAWVQCKSENCKLVTRARGNRRRPVLLQTLSTRDFDELVQAFPRWGLRFRQLGRGPFRGHLQSLRLGGTQVFRAAVNRRMHIEGWPPPGGCRRRAYRAGKGRRGGSLPTSRRCETPWPLRWAAGRTGPPGDARGRRLRGRRPTRGGRRGAAGSSPEARLARRRAEELEGLLAAVSPWLDKLSALG